MARSDHTGMTFVDPLPTRGDVRDIAPGVKWARLPLPFRLNHVNVWLLPEVDGYTLIDCGVEGAEMRALWDDMLAGPLEGQPITRFVATHGHTDHVGLSGYLCERFDIPYVSTLGEWLWPRLRHLEAAEPARPQLRRFMTQHGCDEALIQSMIAARPTFVAALGPPPAALVRLVDGQIIRMGGFDWRVMVAAGHADEHASFYCEETRVLIAGDQILSHISPVVGVFPNEPDGDPLADYLASLPRFAELPEDTLVLPSHGTPFRGLHARVNWLASHHDERLDKLLGLLDQPVTTSEAAHRLFTRAMAEGAGMLAVAETLSHLHRLVGQGRLAKSQRDDGVMIFSPLRG